MFDEATTCGPLLNISGASIRLHELTAQMSCTLSVAACPRMLHEWDLHLLRRLPCRVARRGTACVARASGVKGAQRTEARGSCRD